MAQTQGAYYVPHVHNLSEPDLIILAARPSMGKTACAVQIATETAEQGYPVAVFSLEMSSRQLMCRVITSKSGVPFLRVANNEIYQNEAENFRTACNDANNLKIVIDDTAGMSEHQIKSKAIRLKKKYGIKLFVIDYLQMMHSGSKTNSREQEISNSSRALKGVAKSTKTPVIALSQLSRKCEERTDKRPVPLLILATVLFWLSRGRFTDRLKPGELFLVYLGGYSIIRFFLEFLRLDVSLVNGVNANQVFFAIMLLLCTVVLIRNRLVPNL